jgi:hypothetical protein
MFAEPALRSLVRTFFAAVSLPRGTAPLRRRLALSFVRFLL